MNWKDTIGKYFSEKGFIREKYLNESLLRPTLKDLVNYLNEFDGNYASVEEFTLSKDKMNLNLGLETRFQLIIYYPGDTRLYGKDCDRKDRRFLAEVYFTSKGLHIKVYYRKRGGKFLGHYQEEKEKANEFNGNEGNPENEDQFFELVLKEAKNYQARDVYHEVMTMEESMDPDTINAYLFYLFTEHVKHVAFTNR